MTNFEQAFKDLDSASSKEFVAKFEKEVHLHSVHETLVDSISYQTWVQFSVGVKLKSGTVAHIETKVATANFCLNTKFDSQ